MKTFFEKLPNGTLVNYSLQDDGWAASLTGPKKGITTYPKDRFTTLSAIRNRAWRSYLAGYGGLKS